MTSGSFEGALFDLSAQAPTADDLAQVALIRALQATGDEGGGVVLFDLLSPDLAPLAFASKGWSVETAESALSRWRAELPLGSAREHSSSRLFTHPVPYERFNRSAVAEVLCEGDQIAGILHLEAPAASSLRNGARGRLGALASALVAGIYRQLLLRRLEECGYQRPLIGHSPAFLQLERRLRSASAHGSGAVLISGERGSGKELAARSVHFWSRHWREPFVPVLASALAPELFTSELFGHERSSFSGADRMRPGKLVAADGGTVFLDEVGDLPPAVQSALLRLVEYGEVHRVGRDLPLSVNVRVIAATNRDLDGLVESGRFRPDLYDRLRVIEVRVPPLRERRADVRPLAQHFFRKHCGRFRRERAFSATTLCERCGTGEIGCATEAFFDALESYSWPGNVRELEHLMVQVMASAPGAELDLRHLPPHVREPDATRPKADPEDLRLDTAVRNHIERVLAATAYNQSRAAKLLGLPLSTMRSKIKKLGIEFHPAGE